MSSLSRFFLMMLLSVAVFIFFASLDEYKNVIMPFFKTEKAEVVVPGGSDLKANFEGVLKRFNEKLSQAYISADPAESEIIPADNNIRTLISKEVEFLIKNNKVLKFSVADLTVEDVERSSNFLARVKTREVVSVSYLNLSDRQEVLPMQTAEHQMIYTLAMDTGRWIVVGMDTVGVEKAK